ncbi:hypothetical protein [Kitasatospora sp. NPDC004272]
MNGVPQVMPETARQPKRRWRIGLLLWFVLQWVLIPVELVLTVVWIPLRTVMDVAEEKDWFLLGWARMLLRPLHRFVGPARFVREWTDDQRRWEARLAEICRTAAAAFAGGPGRKYAFRGWANLRWGVGFESFEVRGRDYRGARPEPVLAIAAQHGLYVFFHQYSSDFLLSPVPLEGPGKPVEGWQAEGRQASGQQPVGQPAYGQHQPGQYPVGQHQPGQHQPGQHQPGQYPPGQYPAAYR